MIIENNEALAPFRHAGRCEYCHRYCNEYRDPHHVSARGMAGGKQLDVRCNLLALCRCCHNQVHAGLIQQREFQLIVADREGVPVEWVRECLWLLNRLDNDASPERVEEELAGRPEGFKALVRRELTEGAKLWMQ